MHTYSNLNGVEQSACRGKMMKNGQTVMMGGATADECHEMNEKTIPEVGKALKMDTMDLDLSNNKYFSSFMDSLLDNKSKVRKSRLFVQSAFVIFASYLHHF